MKRAAPWLLMPAHLESNARPTRRNTSIGGLSFAVEIDGQNIPMRISERALRTIFAAGRSPSTWLEAYRRNAQAIDARATAVHREKPEMPVCLDIADFTGVQA